MPANDVEALKSDLMGLLEKRRCKKFFVYVQNYNPADIKTHDSNLYKKNIKKAKFNS